MSEKETIEIPYKDLSFLVLNCHLAFELLKSKDFDLGEEEEIMEELYEKYIPKIHYWSVGQYYDKEPEE